MGIYFIAAGNSSRNREKTLDRSHTVEEICQYLTPSNCELLKQYYHSESAVYVWGANSLSELSQLNSGEQVIDVKNKVVIRVFTYCFHFKTENTHLQEFLGWDREKPLHQRRPYNYVYFLKSPVQTYRKDKSYFQAAFGMNGNQNWLVGQRYFNDEQVHEAFKRTGTTSVEDLIGTTSREGLIKSVEVPLVLRATNPIIEEPASQYVKEQIRTEFDWLSGLTEKVNALKKDQGHLERDHEDLVALLFELLGYERICDIKFRRGNIDIRIEKDGIPLITVEVKADWNLSNGSRGALSQAYNYAQETGTPYVIITNGDRYCIYDRRKGMSYEQNLIADFAVTEITQAAVDTLEYFRKDKIDK